MRLFDRFRPLRLFTRTAALERDVSRVEQNAKAKDAALDHRVTHLEALDRATVFCSGCGGLYLIRCMRIFEQPGGVQGPHIAACKFCAEWVRQRVGPEVKPAREATA